MSGIHGGLGAQWLGESWELNVWPWLWDPTLVVCDLGQQNLSASVSSN